VLIRIAALTAGIAVSALFFYSWIGSSEAGWAIAGAVVGAMVVLVLYEIRISAGTIFRRAGLDAQDAAHDLLNRISGARVISQVNFENWDVDHVVVSRDGVLVIETKWTGKSNIENVRDFPDLAKALDQARESARKIRLLLSDADFRQPIDVEPAVLLMGIALPEVPGGVTRIDDVLILIGHQSWQWATLFQTRRLDSWMVHAIAGGLEERKRLMAASANAAAEQ
jgi:hypothetical protein